jgi:hypothetical protein
VKQSLGEAASERDISKAHVEKCTVALEAATVAWNAARDCPQRSDVHVFGVCNVISEDESRRSQVGENVTFVHMGDAIFKLFGKMYPVHSAILLRSPTCSQLINKPAVHEDRVEGKVIIRSMQVSPRSVHVWTTTQKQTLDGVVCGERKR